MQLERVEERKAMWYRVPEAPWVRSELEGLSQSPIDHGIQPVHDPMTLTIKLRKTRARAGKKKKGRGREREKEKERVGPCNRELCTRLYGGTTT